MAETDVLPPLRDADAVVFDVDGVVTDSARVHATAWKAAFDAYLRAHPPAEPDQRRPFDAETDYLRYVDGKPRLDGAASFLASRGLDTGPDAVEEVAAAKEKVFVGHLRSGDIEPYPGTVRLLHALHRDGVPLAAASSSRHATELLRRAGVADLFAAIVDGGESRRLGLPGKPDPALFLHAAERLERPPARTAVVEDALAGVEAGHRGGFATVIGIDRLDDGTHGPALREHGADTVVRDLAELLAPDAPPPHPAHTADSPREEAS
ncbi:HAD-IA family hydrolase [Streptomyces albidoflavus]|uniref:HAD family hydrolase n=1 Tax=Streptomyces albidoflavus TaxID=1886 RepID=UPI0038736511|nr:HAD-IA family hydrolase [Streptomyces albidoflavus]